MKDHHAAIPRPAPVALLLDELPGTRYIGTMFTNPSSFPTDECITLARQHIEACRASLGQLLEQSRGNYQGALAELEGLDMSLRHEENQPATSQLETLRRSQQLHQSVGALERGVARLEGARLCLDEADAALEGRPGRLGKLEQPSEVALEAVAIQAQEEERYRLAREIHDGPAQILANMALQLEYISKLALKEPARARDEMVTIQRDLRLAVGEVRRFMYDLRPPALAQQGVGPAVESHCQRLADRFGLEIAVRWDASRPLPPSWDSALFRIVQEALQNVVKHSRATRVEVRAVERDDLLVVSVTDNGRGFDLQTVHDLDPSHFGMAGMRARAQQMDASLEVNSAPRQGTAVFLRVPLR